MEQLFPVPHGQSGRLQIEDDSYTWPRFRLQSNSPLPCVTAYQCAITMSEKIVHLTLTPPSLQIPVIHHHVVFCLSQHPQHWWGMIEIPSLVLARKMLLAA